MRNPSHARDEMVKRQLVSRGIRDALVLRAMGQVPREAFLPDRLAHRAYADGPLPIAQGQTISQPYIVALMIEALELTADDRALEIGTGSGYAAAVLSRIAHEVYTVERHAQLAEQAQARFEALGYDNIQVRIGDGTRGWTAHAPYQAIVVAAGGPELPVPLLQQMDVGGRLVIPIGDRMNGQELVRVRRQDETHYTREDLGAVRFVPLIGDEGWQR